MPNTLPKKKKIVAPRIANKGGYQVQDIWFHRAKAAGYRARSAFKLLQIDEKTHILHPGMIVIDLGCAPGSWLQVLMQKVGAEGRILGIDLQEVSKFSQTNVTTYVGDMTTPETHAVVGQYLESMGMHGCDLVTSDVAPRTSGRNDDDQYHSAELCLKVLSIASHFLVRDGALVMKIFRGRDLARVIAAAKNMFSSVHCIKPEACRDRSFEEYVVCRGFGGKSIKKIPSRRSATPSPNKRKRSTPASTKSKI